MTKSKKYVVSIAASLACSAPLACGTAADTEGDIAQGTSALSGTAARVLGFEQYTDWTLSSGIKSINVKRRQGEFSYGALIAGWAELTSPRLSSSELGPVTSRLALDFQLPTAQPNPYWYGQVQLFLSIPSRNINNLPLGVKELTGSITGEFTTLEFDLSPAQVAALETTYSDARFKLALNVPTGTARKYLIDNLRFVPGGVRTHRVDAFLMGVSACAIGTECTPESVNCMHFYDASGNVISEIHGPTIAIVRQSDPRVPPAEKSFCFNFGYTNEMRVMAATQLETFKNEVYSYTRGALNLDVRIHEIALLDTEMSVMARGGGNLDLLLNPDDVEDFMYPYLSADTDFVFATHSSYDATTGIRGPYPSETNVCGHALEHPLEARLRGASFAWAPFHGLAACSDDVYLHEWLHLVEGAYFRLNAWQDIYLSNNDPVTHAYPPCGQYNPDRTLWLPVIHENLLDPDYPGCGDEWYEGNWGEHILSVHWGNRVLIANHCKDGVQDVNETGIDTGGSCSN